MLAAPIVQSRDPLIEVENPDEGDVTVIRTILGASLPVERLCVSKVFHDALGAAAAPPPTIYLSRALRGEFRKKPR